MQAGGLIAFSGYMQRTLYESSLFAADASLGFRA